MKLFFHPVFLSLMTLICLSIELSVADNREGKGAEYQINSMAGPGIVSIYFLKDEGPKNVGIEMYFRSTGIGIPIELWQQFHLKRFANNAGFKIDHGYIHSKQFQTHTLSADYLKGFDGVQINQFMISSPDDLKKYFKGKEKVTVPAGTVEASKYTVNRNGQVVTFWIHDSSKPIGLIKLESQGPKAAMTYTLRLNKLISNVKPTIDPKKAKPMDAAIKSFLPKPNSQKVRGLFLL